MKIHSAVLMLAVTFLFSMTHSSNNSIGLRVSHLHLYRFVSAKIYMPWALFELAFNYGQIEIKQSLESLAPQEGRISKNEQFHSMLSLPFYTNICRGVLCLIRHFSLFRTKSPLVNL